MSGTLTLVCKHKILHPTRHENKHYRRRNCEHRCRQRILLSRAESRSDDRLPPLNGEVLRPAKMTLVRSIETSGNALIFGICSSRRVGLTIAAQLRAIGGMFGPHQPVPPGEVQSVIIVKALMMQVVMGGH